MNFFECIIYTADRAEDARGNDNVDAIVRDVLHILGESDDESIHFDVRMIGLFLEKLLLEKRVDFDDGELTFGRIKFKIVSRTRTDFENPKDSLFPQFRIG